MTLTELADRWQNTTDERATCECFTCRAMPAVVAALRELEAWRVANGAVILDGYDGLDIDTKDTDRELAKLEAR